MPQPRRTRTIRREASLESQREGRARQGREKVEGRPSLSGSPSLFYLLFPEVFPVHYFPFRAVFYQFFRKRLEFSPDCLVYLFPYFQLGNDSPLYLAPDRPFILNQ